MFFNSRQGGQRSTKIKFRNWEFFYFDIRFGLLAKKYDSKMGFVFLYYRCKCLKIGGVWKDFFSPESGSNREFLALGV